MESDIIKLQQQHYEDKQEDSVYQQQLQNLIAEYEDIFDTESTEPARVPEIHIDLKPEFCNKRFFRPEPLRSIKEQKIIDENATKLIKQGKARLNPTSIHTVILDRLLYQDLIKMVMNWLIEQGYVLMLDQSTKDLLHTDTQFQVSRKS